MIRYGERKREVSGLVNLAFTKIEKTEKGAGFFAGVGDRVRGRD